MLTIKQYSNGSCSYYSELKKKHINIPSELAKEILELQKEKYPDTEADGWVFCGKCGKNKDL